MPDLEVTADDILIDPPAPIAGERVSVTVSVRNKGLAEASGAVLEIYHEDPKGNLKLIKSEAIPSLAIHSDKAVSVSIDTKGKIGTNAVVAIIDPDNKIRELSEANNIARKEFPVSESEGVTMTTTIDSAGYQGRQDAHVTIHVRNSGFESDIGVEVWVEDELGNSVELHDTLREILPSLYHLAGNCGRRLRGDGQGELSGPGRRVDLSRCEQRRPELYPPGTEDKDAGRGRWRSGAIRRGAKAERSSAGIEGNASFHLEHGPLSSGGLQGRGRDSLSRPGSFESVSPF